MGLSKEQQRESAEMIMATEPLTDQERSTYERFRMTPAEYPRADRDNRVCQECGAEFKTIPATKDREELSAFQMYVDHSTIHNPTAGQWATAHQRIRQAMDTQKGAAARSAGE